VGMVAVVTPESLAGVLAHSAELGLDAWVLGEVSELDTAPDDIELVAGTKGVHGGAVAMTGSYRAG